MQPVQERVVARSRPPGRDRFDERRGHGREGLRDDFVLIGQYSDIAETFMLGGAMSAESGLDRVAGYRIFKTQP